MEVGRFKNIWNEIIGIFREEDIIGDRYVLSSRYALSDFEAPNFEVQIYHMTTRIM